MPSSPSTLATAPSSMSVLRVRRLSSSLARRQSGRMLEKICLCLTWPAITAWVTPSLLEGLDQPRQLAQREPVDGMPGSAAARASISGSVSSLMAATTTSDAVSARGVEQQKRKAAVAGDQTQPGDRLQGVTLLLLDDAALGTFDKGDQVSHAAPPARLRRASVPSACEVFSLAASRMRYACCRAFNCCALKPDRSRPI